MVFFIVLMIIIIPLLMVFANKYWVHTHIVLVSIATICLIVFESITATTVYEIIRENVVFMTTVHVVFLNPLFLITGGYLGVFFLYLLFLRLSMNNQ
ncbi:MULTISPECIES: transposase [Cytobacillus]|uniref:Transposase n=1 Tax=Cytobacillus stercorigallinarum TaxID=2762240 RepID=A0ABR8QU87_9BACI|nr:transposase [Cytobacillus stercorigallinarum]MBD7939073.1 transposase [Cytobacillus stercorigallinarum]